MYALHSADDIIIVPTVRAVSGQIIHNFLQYSHFSAKIIDYNVTNHLCGYAEKGASPCTSNRIKAGYYTPSILNAPQHDPHVDLHVAERPSNPHRRSVSNSPAHPQSFHVLLSLWFNLKVLLESTQIKASQEFFKSLHVNGQCDGTPSRSQRTFGSSDTQSHFLLMLLSSKNTFIFNGLSTHAA